MLPSGCGLCDGLVHFIAVMVPETSNGVEDGLTKVGIKGFQNVAEFR